jgi:hypothetical protein
MPKSLNWEGEEALASVGRSVISPKKSPARGGSLTHGAGVRAPRGLLEGAQATKQTSDAKNPGRIFATAGETKT